MKEYYVSKDVTKVKRLEYLKGTDPENYILFSKTR